MVRHYEYCPNCQSIRSMSVSIALQQTSTPDQTDDEVLVMNYHCESCMTFIRHVPLNQVEKVGFNEFDSVVPMI
jgi:hypothetical protein